VNQSLARHCPQCKQYGEVDVKAGNFSCPECHHHWGKVSDPSDLFDYCPVCQCRQFYLSKDFNQALGCTIMLIGIVLVPWTFGLSLPVFALVDWLLYRRIPAIINCYKCGTEFRNIKTDKKFKTFMHHIGLKYDKYR